MRNVAARACAHASLLPFPPPGLLPGPRPPLAVVFPEGMTRAFPRGCVRNLCLVYHNTEDRNGPYQGFAELVKSFLILPTKENWCGNKKKKKRKRPRYVWGFSFVLLYPCPELTLQHGLIALHSTFANCSFSP